ncbi:MAG: tRNA pseudouridine(38-40) synthase TruA [Bacteroidales bacterium]|nr:tRNA pseudouridine(38-40) synthase TruA [Bacteroidales bacterium]
MRYFLSLSYDGTDFCGWQIQPSSPSVQACLEEALSRLLGGPVPVTGAGRTDTGVHASGYVAHFDWPGSLPFEAPDFIYKLNAILPHSVAVFSVTPVPDDLHARFSAVRREYTYFIHRRKDPFVRNYSWLCGYPNLDFDAMNEACRYLLGTHDFSCFEKTGGDNKTSICTVTEAFWKPYTPTLDSLCHSERSEESLYWYFRVSADRFLRNMVRATVGSLIEVGRGRHRPEWIAELIASGTRSDAGESVPGHALFLNKVSY